MPVRAGWTVNPDCLGCGGGKDAANEWHGSIVGLGLWFRL